MPRKADPRVARVIGRNLKARIGEAEIQEVAKRLGMAPNQLSQYIGGHRGFAAETLIRIAAKLPCTIDDLVVGVDLTYTREIVRRRYAGASGEIGPDLRDVIGGFLVVAAANPDEAKGMAEMLRTRLLHADGHRQMATEPPSASPRRKESPRRRAGGAG